MRDNQALSPLFVTLRLLDVPFAIMAHQAPWIPMLTSEMQYLVRDHQWHLQDHSPRIGVTHAQLCVQAELLTLHPT